jgi:hypothetical protein
MAAKKTKASKARKSAAAKTKPKAPARKPVAKKAGAPKKKPLAAKKRASAAKKARAPKKPVVAKKKARAPKKPVAAKKKASAPKKPAPVKRRDGAGHLDPKYAAMLREKSREGRVDDSDKAFVGARAKDPLAEEMGETWVATATSGEDESQDVYSQNVPEDEGGPFVPTTAGQEFAEGTDASNPAGAKREPFPRT